MQIADRKEREEDDRRRAQVARKKAEAEAKKAAKQAQWEAHKRRHEERQRRLEEKRQSWKPAAGELVYVATLDNFEARVKSASTKGVTVDLGGITMKCQLKDVLPVNLPDD